jgi:hypothetical protein
MESDLNVRSHEHRCEMKHLQEKKKFLEQWDRDHQEAWEETQVAIHGASAFVMKSYSLFYFILGAAHAY